MSPEARGPSKADRVYDILRRRIREAALEPGASLRKDEIAAELGVSRAPVSEALARLADEGLVEIFPQHGSFVAPIRASEVREALFIRAALEIEAMRRLAPVADQGLIARLEENLAGQARALDAGDLPRFHDLDEALHGLLFSAMDLPRARRMLDAARAPLDRLRRRALPAPGRPQATLAEHRWLVEAIRAGDADLAAAAMRAHLSRVADSVERELAAAPAGAILSEA